MKGVVYLEKKDLIDFMDYMAAFALDDCHTYFVNYKEARSVNIKKLVIDHVSADFSLEFENKAGRVVFWITNLDNEEKFTIEAIDDQDCTCSECGDIVHPDKLHGGANGLCSDCNIENEREERNSGVNEYDILDY